MASAQQHRSHETYTVVMDKYSVAKYSVAKYSVAKYIVLIQSV